METISPKIAEKAEIDEYETFGIPPIDFDPRNAERKKIFAERLKTLRKDRGLKLKTLAAELGVTPMAISKYENNKLAAIPTDHLRRLAVFYEVSPHYLLGYVDEKNAYAALNEDKTLKKDENGLLKIMHGPMCFKPASYQEAVERYKALYLEDNDFFYLIHKILISKEPKREFCKKMLQEIDARNLM